MRSARMALGALGAGAAFVISSLAAGATPTSPESPSSHDGSERVTAAVSAVASNPEARRALIAQQRLEIVSNSKRIVAEGRDITTVVAPDATVRILLTASEEVRKARRGEQLGGDRTSEQLEADVSRRDAADSRVNNFTEAAEGVDLVDSTDLDFEQTVAEVIRVIDETAARNHEQKQQEDSGDSGTEDDEQESGA